MAGAVLNAFIRGSLSSVYKYASQAPKKATEHQSWVVSSPSSQNITKAWWMVTSSDTETLSRVTDSKDQTMAKRKEEKLPAKEYIRLLRCRKTRGRHGFTSTAA
jgi:hypothetical protein